MNALMPADLRGAVVPELNLRLLAFALAVSLVTGVVFGLAPLGRLFSMRWSEGLAARGVEAARSRSRVLLVVGEVALALVVVASAGLLVRTLRNLQNVDPGFRADHVLTARLEQFGPNETIEGRKRFYDEVVERVESLPGVLAAGFTTFLPYTSLNGSSLFLLEDRPDLPRELSVAYRREVTPGFAEAMGLPLVAGRNFSPEDDLDGPPVLIVSEDIADLLGGDAVGRRVGFLQGPGQTPIWTPIVGVVGSIRQESLDRPPERGVIYTPVAQSRQLGFFSPRDLVVRTSANPAALASAIREEVWAVDPDQSVANVQTLEMLVDGQISKDRTLAILFSTFSALVLFLAALGVYGLMSFVVAARAREFGLRVALGAARRDLALSVLGRGGVWIGGGLALGLAMTLAVTWSLRSLLYGVEPVDPVSLIVAVLVLCGAGVIAALVPVWRATRSDPMVVLRFD